MKKIMVTGCLLLAGALVATGETAYWTNDTTQVKGTDTAMPWGNSANWTNSVGALFTVAPTNGEDAVIDSLPPIPAERAYLHDNAFYGQRRQRVTTSTSSKASGLMVNPIVNKVTGGERYVIQLNTYENSSDAYYAQGAETVSSDGRYHRQFDVTDPNDFWGYWEPLGMFSRMLLHPGADFTPVLHNFSSKHRPYVNVPNDTAEIGYLYHGGALDKTGAGELKISGTDNNPTYYWLREGTLTLKGGNTDDLTALLARAALHLDASDATTFETRDEGDDQTGVTKWSDVRGTSYPYAQFTDYHSTHSSFLPFVNTPLYVTNASPTGLPVVDFGAQWGKEGRTNCVLKIQPGTVTGIRAAFYAADCPNGARNAMILGDTGSLQFVAGMDTSLYDITYSDPAARTADIMINMQASAYKDIPAATLKNMYAYGARYSRGMKVGLLGSREYYSNTTGGSRIGELILFTEELTQAEKALLSQYLYRKWVTGAQKTQVTSGINAEKNSATVNVPSGRTAQGGDVYAEKGLVKTGAGVLEVSSMQPTSAVVTVRGGSVKFTPHAVTTTIPQDAYIWLDAEKVGAGTNFVDGVTYMNTWADCRDDVAMVATSGDSTGGTHRPTFVAKNPTVKRPAVNFGTYGGEGETFAAGSENAAWMYFPNWTKSASTYEYFIVFRFNYDPTMPKRKKVRVLGSSDMSGYRDDSAGHFLSVYYPNPVTTGARWSVNGNVVDPWSYAPDCDNTNDFMVVAVSSQTPFKADGIAKDRYGTAHVASCGGLEVGEVLTWTRKLTADEHVSVEAYLLRKWLNKEHPLTGKNVTKVVYDDDVPAVVGADDRVTLWDVSGGSSDTFVKRGSGTLFVPALTNYMAVSVEEGTLVMSASTNGPLAKAQFRLDASAEDSFLKDEEGGVLVWFDADGRNMSAIADTDGLANIKPRIVNVETAAGLTRPVMDFGALSWTTNGVGDVQDAASMTLSQVFKSQEAFLVAADAHGSKAQSFFCNVTSHEFERGLSNGTIFNYNSTDFPSELRSSSIVVNSWMHLDGEHVTWTKAVTDGFHLFNWMLLTASSPHEIYNGWYPMPIGAIARWTYTCQKNKAGESDPVEIDRRGGLYVAEQLSFAKVLTDEERAYVQAYLNAKWFGGTAQYETSFGRADVAEGATLKFSTPACEHLTLEAVSGLGTIVRDELTIGKTLEATIAKDETRCLAVEGTVTFGDAMTLNLTADVTNGHLEGGLYPILTASAISDFNAAVWTVHVTTEGPTLGTIRVEKQGNTLYARVPRRGTRIIIR